MTNDQTNQLLEDAAKLGKQGCGERFKFVEKGGWRTLEWFWNVPSSTCYFRDPGDAEIKVRYGVGFFGADGQKQKLDGRSVKELNVAGASFFFARMQMKVKNSTEVVYVYCPH